METKTDSDTTAQPLPAAGFVLLAALTVFWGLNWPALKVVLIEFPVWWFRSLCLLTGGIGLLAIARLSGYALKVPATDVVPLLISTGLNVIGWHLMSAYGVSLIPAGRAVIIAFTMPIWAALLSCWFLKEALTASKLAGLALGLAGLAVLIGHDLAVLQVAPLGALFMLLAAMSWGGGTVAIKKFSWIMPPIGIVGWQLLIGAVPITAGALLLEPFPDLHEISGRAWLGVAYVLALPILFCQWAYFKTVTLFPASITALGTLAIPVVGVYSSAWLLGEAVGLQEFSALVLICAALFCVLVLPALNSKQAAEQK